MSIFPEKCQFHIWQFSPIFTLKIKFWSTFSKIIKKTLFFPNSAQQPLISHSHGFLASRFRANHDEKAISLRFGHGFRFLPVSIREQLIIGLAPASTDQRAHVYLTNSPKTCRPGVSIRFSVYVAFRLSSSIRNRRVFS